MVWKRSSSPAPGELTPDTSLSDERCTQSSASPDDITKLLKNTAAITKLSTMEAEHLNQLNNVTGACAERELQYKEEVQSKEVQLQQSQNRIDAVERRIRERDVQLTSLKDEKAGSMRQIADLKNQLYQLQFEVEETTCDKADITQQWQAKLVDTQHELSEAKRALDNALKIQVDAVTKATTYEEENNNLKKQLQSNQGSNESEGAELQKQLAELQSANATLTTQIAEEKAATIKSKQLSEKEVANLRSMLRSRDDSIKKLQGRANKGQEDMTKLEAELDTLRSVEDNKQTSVKERVTQLNGLSKENEEMKQLVESQNQALKDMTAKWDKQKEEYQEQCKVVKERGEEINKLTLALQEGEREKEAVLQRSNSDNHSRVSTLEMELQKMNEKVDELTSTLNETMEELEDLQADVVYKEGRIASLEKEIEEASSLLINYENGEVAASSSSSPSSSPSRRESGNFAKLRKEIERVTRERAQLESDHALQLSLLKNSKGCDIIKMEKERDELLAKVAASTEKITALEKSCKDLEHQLEKTREVMDQLDAEEDLELEESKVKVNELQLANDELRTQLKDKEQEMAKQEVSAQQALTALEKEREQRDDKNDDSDAKIKALDEELEVCKREVYTSEATLSHTIREKEMVISDLKSELISKEQYAEELKDELESVHLSVERGPSKRNYGMSIDPEWHEPDTISKLRTQVSTLTKARNQIEKELRSKIDARDSTIATLVLSASNQESNILEMRTELNRVRRIVNSQASSEHDVSQQLKSLESERKKEVDALKERTNELTIELKQTKRKLELVNDELECAKSQLEAADTMPDVQDLAGRLVVSENTCKMLKNENSDQLKERDAAITNLLLSVQANEGVISNLRQDIESFKMKLNLSNEENRRLQHESEIFAAQIIDQDEEFESLNERLKAKADEVATLKREIASSSSDMRNMKNLQSEVDELREEKRHNTSRIHKLESELRDMELRKAEQDGFQIDRLKIELKNAINDKAMAEDKMTNQIESLRKLRNHTVEDFEKQLHEKSEEISALEKELLELKESRGGDDLDDIFLDDDKQGLSKNQLLEERDSLLAKIETLGDEVEALRASSEGQLLSDLKDQLAKSEKLREEMEADRSLYNASKDREMDRLHRQMSELREAHTAREMEQLSLLKKLETENYDMREEFTMRMQEKNSKIVALEQTLAAQEQVVGNMSREMDQLQNGMEKVSIQRRAEIEELQQELMDYTSKSTKLEREVIALSMKLDDKKHKHRTAIEKLKDRIASLESETPREKAARQSNTKNDKSRERKLEEKNDHLKWLNTSLKDENDKLKENVDYLEAHTEKLREDSLSPSKSSKSDKWKCVALQEQVAVLSQRVIELEEAASLTAASLRRPPQSPVIRSSGISDKDTSSRSFSAPKSALRTSSYYAGANDLLSNADEDRARITSTPPPVPRPSTPKGSPQSVGSGSRSSKGRFSLSRKKSGGKDSVMSNGSTANYDF